MQLSAVVFFEPTASAFWIVCFWVIEEVVLTN